MIEGQLQLDSVLVNFYFCINELKEKNMNK